MTRMRISGLPVVPKPLDRHNASHPTHDPKRYRMVQLERGLLGLAMIAIVQLQLVFSLFASLPGIGRNEANHATCGW